MRKVPTTLQHNDDLILSLRSPKKLYVTFIVYFLVILLTFYCRVDRKTRIGFNGCFTVNNPVFDIDISILGTLIGHVQITVPKIDMPMSKTACINPSFSIIFQVSPFVTSHTSAIFLFP